MLEQEIDFSSDDDSKYIEDLASICRHLYLGEEQIDNSHIKQSKMKAVISNDDWTEQMIDAELKYRRAKQKEQNIDKSDDNG